MNPGQALTLDFWLRAVAALIHPAGPVQTACSLVMAAALVAVAVHYWRAFSRRK